MLIKYTRYWVACVALVLLAGCARGPMTFEDRSNLFEEDDYSNWEQADSYFERMAAENKGKIDYQMAIMHHASGTAIFKDKIEDTAGIDISDAAYASSAFVGDITPLNVTGTLLGINSDAPAFGSLEYTTLMNYNGSIMQLINNERAFFSLIEVSENDLAGAGGETPHHSLHLLAKEHLLNSYDRAISAYKSAGWQCQFKGFSEERQYARAAMVIKPLKQYQLVQTCSKGGMKRTLAQELRIEDPETLTLSITTLAMNIDDNSGDTELWTPLDDALYAFEDVVSRFRSCNTCDEDLDRIVVVESKSQPQSWIEKYPLGSIR